MCIRLVATPMLIILVGRRIISNFIRNWLARREAGRLKVTLEKADMAVMAASAAALLVWIIWPDGKPTARLAIVAGSVFAPALLQMNKSRFNFSRIGEAPEMTRRPPNPAINRRRVSTAPFI